MLYHRATSHTKLRSKSLTMLYNRATSQTKLRSESLTMLYHGATSHTKLRRESLTVEWHVEGLEEVPLHGCGVPGAGHVVTLVSVVADYALVVTVEILPQQLERVRPLVVALVLNDDSETQSFTYSYMAADMWLRNEIDNERGRKEGNVLFNDVLNSFYLQLYGGRHVIKEWNR